MGVAKQMGPLQKADSLTTLNDRIDAIALLRYLRVVSCIG
jgi:hypothetical protein